MNRQEHSLHDKAHWLSCTAAWVTSESYGQVNPQKGDQAGES